MNLNCMTNFKEFENFYLKFLENQSKLNEKITQKLFNMCHSENCNYRNFSLNYDEAEDIIRKKCRIKQFIGYCPFNCSCISVNYQRIKEAVTHSKNELAIQFMQLYNMY